MVEVEAHSVSLVNNSLEDSTLTSLALNRNVVSFFQLQRASVLTAEDISNSANDNALPSGP